MADAKVSENVVASTQETIQSNVKTGDVGNVWVVNWLAKAGLILSPWWSTTRDVELRSFWKNSDHLSGALYNMTSKMSAIPNKVVAKDVSNRLDVQRAETLTNIISDGSQFGDGWVVYYQRFVHELISQDNGVFSEVIGRGRKDGPILGQPLSLAHLDSGRCTRTGNPIYPVIYENTDGIRYKLHFSRVIFTAQMPSPIADMYGVGFSAISRCVNVAQNLIDILVYKQEKLGSRPHREILITRGGLDPEDLKVAFQLAESDIDQQGLTRYSKLVVGGHSTLPEAGIESIELSGLPDGFDEQTSIVLGMATIALALGMDARELFPAMMSGATRADALVQHLKQRGKGPGQILQVTEQQMNFKFIPPRLKFEFDFQDDEQDRQRAEIRKVRADKRLQDTATGAIDERTLREQMMEDGEITQEQFDRMELDSGRLANGTQSLSLFFSKKSEYSQYLDMGVENPLDVINNEPEKMLDAITDKRTGVLETIANAKFEKELAVAERANSALTQLELMYLPPAPIGGEEGTATGNYIDPRTRTQGATSPTEQDRDVSEQIDRADEEED